MLLLILAAVLAGAPTMPARPDSTPVILLVHGRGQLGRDTASLRREWQRSLEAGLQLPVADSLFRGGDVRVVWYADVLDPRSEEGCRFLDTNPRSRERWERRGGAQGFWDLARGVLGLVADAADSTDGDNARGFIGDLLFAADLWKRCGAERRLAEALERATREGRPVILVSHSFGALVTYGYLEGYRSVGAPPPDVRRWITVGSMLGVAAVRQLLLGDGSSELPRPALVRSWLNVRDPDDAFAARAAEGGGRSNAVEIETDARGGPIAHELPSYLRNPKTARAIVFAWCAAFGDRRAAPAWCLDVADADSVAR